jgi:hypothetical protein
MSLCGFSVVPQLLLTRLVAPASPELSDLRIIHSRYGSSKDDVVRLFGVRCRLVLSPPPGLLGMLPEDIDGPFHYKRQNMSYRLALSVLSLPALLNKGSCQPILPNVLRNLCGYSRVALAWMAVLSASSVSPSAFSSFVELSFGCSRSVSRLLKLIPIFTQASYRMI